jgi:hypothetical protein
MLLEDILMGDIPPMGDIPLMGDMYRIGTCPLSFFLSFCPSENRSII